MCGIAFIASKDNLPARHIKAVCDKIRHRGKNDSGYLGLDPDTLTSVAFSDEDSQVQLTDIRSTDEEFPLYFGHRRLSIVDLTTNGHQPYRHANRYELVYNGEIYNYIELKEELIAKGYSFTTNTDTEVVPIAYHEWGVDCFNRFNGMWSIVLYDSLEKCFVISRDRMGIKPLYFHIGTSQVSFASEIKGLLELPWVKKEANLNYCQSFLKKGASEYGEECAFVGIQRMQNGTYFKGNLDQLWEIGKRQKKFWSVTPNLELNTFDPERCKQLAKTYLDKLSDAVALRQRADVKIGSALSGGIDSSSIVYLVNKHLNEKKGNAEMQATFSSVYKSQATKYCDESEYIELLAKQLGLMSYQIEPELDKIVEDHKKMIFHMDTPPSASMLASWNTFKLASNNNITVSLDGQGADELFGGYSRYFVNHLVHFKGDYKAELKSILQMEGKSKYALQGAKLRKLRHFKLDKLREALTGKKTKILMPLNQRLAVDLDDTMANLLHYSDRTSMAFGIESRVPFLDFNLIEFAMEVPAEYKIHNGWTKHLSRMAFEGMLPKEILWRKDKMGWPIPEEFYFRTHLKDWFIETIKASNILETLGENQSIEKRVNSDEPIQPLVRLLNLAVWENVFFDGKV